jgi:hypothetical protein
VLYRVLVLCHQVFIDRLAHGCDSYFLHRFLVIIAAKILNNPLFHTLLQKKRRYFCTFDIIFSFYWSIFNI